MKAKLSILRICQIISVKRLLCNKLIFAKCMYSISSNNLNTIDKWNFVVTNVTTISTQSITTRWIHKWSSISLIEEKKLFVTPINYILWSSYICRSNWHISTQDCIVMFKVSSAFYYHSIRYGSSLKSIEWMLQ